MRQIFLRLMCALGIIAMASSCGNSGQKQNKEKEKTMTFDVTALSEEPVLDIKTDLGTIKVKLYKETPLHRDNFLKLASEGYYDGLLFHRVINGFMIQTGDPLTKDPAQADLYGTGGPGYTIPAEIIPGLTHKKGALAAARRGDAANPKKESSGSQFYIVQNPATCAQLDGEYTVFGETLEGFDVIDRIAAVQTGAKDRPVKDIKIISIRPDMPVNAEAAAAEKDSSAAAKDSSAAETQADTTVAGK